MLTPRLLVILCAFAVAIPSAWAFGDSDKPQPAAESVEQLIQQLDSAEYAQREAACGKLTAKGKAAIPALQVAAAAGNLEVGRRALGVLSKLTKSSDEPTAKAAHEALGKLADGDSPAAARKAKSILGRENPGANNVPGMAFPGGGGIILGPGMGGMGMGGMGGQIIIRGGVLQIGGGAGIGRPSISNNNGVREIEATEGDKKVKISDDPAKGIKIESTDKVNGKVTTQKYDAKNVDDLKKNSPEGYKLYKEYAEQQGNGINRGIQIGGFAAPAPLLVPALPLRPAIPLPAPAPPPPPPAVVPGHGIVPATTPGDFQAAVLQFRIKQITEQIKSLQKRDADLKDASTEKKAELKKQLDELSQRIGELQKQLESK